ncbi:MAG: hypothetical protein A3F31_00565 [Candidatus Levybacteria bacterium RIFCSPHIGHO2_12_FULL_38_12]|nr:MAG: hypothetical protein A2770_02860 [Candidatus Levybacteria bacterium RIFCSPHIGHO2_01_FULL_38_12]OGH22758.1 MAG: hypothetical protein A3F31_00565 [Candidatus Levybacteria bacterium RIFCSPHIGHO2_12_FULL_38_12]OGH45011.1 MAG: hypothetical protein A3J14_04000 [Candidatus Levybacteria bacterium RIFCSPLOWO2_02_FULL_37_18]
MEKEKNFIDKYYLIITAFGFFIFLFHISAKVVPTEISVKFGSYLFFVLFLAFSGLYVYLKDRENILLKYRALLVLSSFLLVGYVIIDFFAPVIFNYKVVQYVYACPNIYTSKCYHVKADMEEDSESDVGYYTRWVESIYFENGGKLTFDYCKDDTTVSNRFICWEESGESWTIDLAEEKKVPR